MSKRRSDRVRLRENKIVILTIRHAACGGDHVQADHYGSRKNDNKQIH